MHDPCTVAFEIRRPWRSRPSQWWPKGYRPPLITIWHVDPEKHSEDTANCRSDDTCGWHTPPIPKKDFDKARKLGEENFEFSFGKHGYRMTTFEATLNTWLMIARRMHGRGRITHRELLYIHSLASNPTDNLRWQIERHPINGAGPYDGIDNAEKSGDFFCLILKCYRRFHRPRWKHPRYHFWHWRFQIHPLQKLRRRMFDRCSECSKPFGWNESPIGTWGGDKLWHDACYPQPSQRPPMTCEPVSPDGASLH